MTGTEYVRTLCKTKGIAISRLEKELGFANGYLNPKKIEYLPLEKALAIKKYIGGDISIMTGKPFNEDEASLPYYLNDDAREMAQFMFENPEYKILFDASRKVSKGDIETVKTIMDKFRSPEAE